MKLEKVCKCKKHVWKIPISEISECVLMNSFVYLAFIAMSLLVSVTFGRYLAHASDGVGQVFMCVSVCNDSINDANMIQKFVWVYAELVSIQAEFTRILWVRLRSLEVRFYYAPKNPTMSRSPMNRLGARRLTIAEDHLEFAGSWWVQAHVYRNTPKCRTWSYTRTPLILNEWWHHTSCQPFVRSHRFLYLIKNNNLSTILMIYPSIFTCHECLQTVDAPHKRYENFD